MDVSISVSLLRDQMGSVIEHAVTAAVETVLGEILKVVRSKFEEFNKEMTAKDEENENIKQMLEISRCQMKTMRKYLSVMAAKDERQVSLNQRKFGKQNEPNRTLCSNMGELQPTPALKSTSKADDVSFPPNRKAQRHFNGTACPSESPVSAAQEWGGMAAHAEQRAARHRQGARGPATSLHAPESLAQVKEEHRGPQDGHDEAVGCHTEPTKPPQGVHAQTRDSGPPSLHKTDVIATATIRASPQTTTTTKEEEAEMELICIKEEPIELETHTLSPPPPDRCPDHLSDGQSSLDRLAPVDDLSGTTLPTMSASPSWLGRPHAQWEASVLQAQQQKAELKRCGQLRRREQEKKLPQPLQAVLERERREKTRIRVARWRAKRKLQACWLGRPQVQWEASTLQALQVQQQKAELKRCSQLRRREREKNLPQPLQAALERERREKTRIRVARWRAKRKLQAGLLRSSQAASLDFQLAQTVNVQASDLMHCHQQYGGLLYSSPHCDNSALYPPLPGGLGRDLPDTLLQAGVTSGQQGILGADSELFQ
ncbi:hypothetical protein AGOR_G00058110 [Albula goreensis]|uniref:Uncharacterized protein n=1 Tax=Albula goreensis TaxID=1534307 RepID=A0A8T3DNS1_9TELE|nr:hypothetical protein AGOR_G00058110 [Albula goreensis]